LRIASAKNQFATVLGTLPESLKIGSSSTVPHCTTLQKAACRLLAAAPARRLLDATVCEHMGRKRRVRRAAIDSTGLESSAASGYFVLQRERMGNAVENGPFSACATDR
jgi:hypothetical protein